MVMWISYIKHHLQKEPKVNFKKQELDSLKGPASERSLIMKIPEMGSCIRVRLLGPLSGLFACEMPEEQQESPTGKERSGIRNTTEYMQHD